MIGCFHFVNVQLYCLLKGPLAFEFLNTRLASERRVPSGLLIHHPSGYMR